MKNVQLIHLSKSAHQVEPIVVTVRVSNFVSDEDLKKYAMEKAGETPQRLFGSRVEHYDEGIREVILYRD